MITINSKSNKRLIIEGLVNDKKANFLIDTGASIALIDKSKAKKYKLVSGREYNGNVAFCR